MRIAVLSPAHKQGASSISAMLASALAKTQEKEVCLTYTGNNKELATYLGISNEYVDKTKTASQIAELLKVNAIKPQDLVDYCQLVSERFYFLRTEINYLDSVDTSQLMEFLVGSLPQEIVIVDVTTDIFEDVTKKVISKSDVVILAVTQEINSVDKLKAWIGSKYFDEIKEKGMVLLVNRYSSLIGNLKPYNKLGFKYGRLCKMHYNPFIVQMSNMGKLNDLTDLIVNKDARVVELNQDFKELMQVVCANSGFKAKWQDKIENKKK